jgi:hypothetical protein
VKKYHGREFSSMGDQSTALLSIVLILHFLRCLSSPRAADPALLVVCSYNRIFARVIVIYLTEVIAAETCTQSDIVYAGTSLFWCPVYSLVLSALLTKVSSPFSSAYGGRSRPNIPRITLNLSLLQLQPPLSFRSARAAECVRHLREP